MVHMQRNYGPMDWYQVPVTAGNEPEAIQQLQQCTLGPGFLLTVIELLSQSGAAITKPFQKTSQVFSDLYKTYV